MAAVFIISFLPLRTRCDKGWPGIMSSPLLDITAINQDLINICDSKMFSLKKIRNST